MGVSGALSQLLHHLFVGPDGLFAVEIGGWARHWSISRHLYILMRMNLAIGSPVNRFLALLLAHPERFSRSEVPCCLQALWEEAFDAHNCGHSSFEDHLRTPTVLDVANARTALMEIATSVSTPSFATREVLAMRRSLNS